MTAAGASHFEEVLTDEISEIQASRKRRLPDIEFPQSSSPDPYTQAHEAQLFGVAFSGGGIRSATFALGVIQSMSDARMLPFLDYLSTVSGGGYIGAMWGRLVATYGLQAAQQLVVDSGAPVLHWLRRNGRYLNPAGSRDTGIAVATYLRSWLAIHI